MKVCFPVMVNSGIESAVYGHFGSAPHFVLVDTDTNAVTPIVNSDQHHSHGPCNPILALNGHHVDAIVVGGIGAGALNKLQQLGIDVYRAQKRTVRDNLELFKAQALVIMSVQHTCAGHGAGGGCSHS